MWSPHDGLSTVHQVHTVPVSMLPMDHRQAGRGERLISLCVQECVGECLGMGHFK